mgnify:CR=1 FL=1
MKRTISLTFACLMVGSLIASACTPKATPPPTGTTTQAPAAPTATPLPQEPAPVPSPTAAQKVTITLWHSWQGDYLKNIEKVFRDYMAANPQVTVELVYVPDLATRVVTAIPAGQGPDLIAWANDQIGKHAEMVLILPLDNWVDLHYMEANYEPVAVRAMEYKGQVWGLPESLETLTLIYNKALIAEEDLPKDTDDLLAKAKAWEEAHPGQHYFVYNARNDVTFAAPWLYGAGGYFVDEVPSVGLNTPGGLAGLELIAQFRPIMPTDVSHGLAATLFQQGQVPLTLSAPWGLADLKRAGVDYGLATLPVVASSGLPARPLVGARCLMLTPNSKNPSVAVEVMKYYTGRDSLIYLARTNGLIPANRLANADVEVKALGDVIAFVQQARLGAPLPTTPAMAAVWDPVAKMLESVWTGQAAPAEAAQTAQERAEENLRALGLEPQSPTGQVGPGLTLEPGLIREFQPIEVTAPVTLTIWHGWPQDYLPAIQEAFDQYTAMNPKVTIHLVNVPDMSEKIYAAVPAGQGPDVIAYSHEWIGRLSQEGIIVPLDAYVDRAAFERDYVSPAVQAVTYKGQTWGFPDMAKAITLIYNKGKIAERDLPRNTDDLLAKGEQWKRDHPGEYLFVYNAKSDAYFSAPWWHAAGAYFVNEAGQVGINTPEGLKAAQFLRQLRGIMPEEVDYGIADTLFREGKAALTLNGPWYLPALEQAGIEVGLALVPAFSPTSEPGRPFVGVETLMVTPNSPNPAVAVDVLRWFTSRPAQVSRAVANRTIPTHRAAVEDPRVQALAVVGHFATQVAQGVAVPPTPYTSALWDPVSKGLEALWTGSTTPEEAIRQIQEQAEQSIREMR